MLDLGLEITIEPDVVPRGTVDLRSLDAAPGTPPPSVRVEPNGRVTRLVAPAEPPVAPTVPSMPVVTPVVTPATPAVSASSSVHANQEALAVEGARVSVSASEPAAPLGARLRKRASSGALPAHAETAIPPRPASASATGASSRLDALPPDDDHETAQISGGFASALGALVKVTLVLVGVTLAVALPLLYWWNDLWPMPASQVASSEPAKKHEIAVPTSASEVKVADAGRAEPSAVASSVPAGEKPEVAQIATASQSAVELGALSPRPDAGSKELALNTPPQEPKVAEEMGGDSDFDYRKVEALRAEAVRLYRQGKFDAAIAKLDEVLKLNPKDSDALFRKALAFHRKGDAKAAALAYEATTQAAPRDTRAWNNLGLVRESLGDVAGARAAWEKGQSYDPSDPNLLVNLGRLDRDAHPETALARFEKALQRDSGHPYARYQRGAVLALALNRVDDGTKELVALSEKDCPVRGEALDTLGLLAMRGRRPADAVEYYKRALAVDPNQDEIRLRLGVALYTAGQNDKAESALRDYVEKHPKSADGWKTLGATLVRLDRLAEAKVAYEKALAENDKDTTSLYNYALCAERFGNFLFAIQEYERVVQIDPNHWKSLENLGRLYRRAGRDQKALDYFDRAIAVQPSEADLHLHRANALTALQRDSEARDELKKFCTLAAPGDKRVAEAQKALASTVELAPAQDAPPPDGAKGF